MSDEAKDKESKLSTPIKLIWLSFSLFQMTLFVKYFGLLSLRGANPEIWIVWIIAFKVFTFLFFAVAAALTSIFATVFVLAMLHEFFNIDIDK